MRSLNDVIDGQRIVRTNQILTIVFGVTAVYAAVEFTTAAQWVGAITAMSLFAIGVFAFLWSYWNAVQRSRVNDIAVSQLYLLMGPGIPRRVKWEMNLTLLAQAAIATVTTFARPDGPDGNPGSSLAVGFLVPMLGFGLNGLWAVMHGSFDVRSDAAGEEGVNATTTGDEIGQNAEHG